VSGLGENACQPDPPLVREKYGHIGVNYDDPLVPGDAVQQAGELVDDVARDNLGRMSACDVHGRGKPGEGRRLGRRAGLQPCPGRLVLEVDRIEVDTNSPGDARQLDRRRGDRAAHVTAKAQPSHCRAVCAGPDPVPIAVQPQPQPGSGAQIDQSHRAGGSAAGRRDAQGDLGAPGHLVHLVPAAAADLDDVLRVRRAECLERGEEPVVELRLGAAGFGEVVG
jgi:hypothetical protein